MKTDDLINLLGTNIEPVKGGQLRNTLLAALAVGAAGALCLLLLIFGAPGEAIGREYLGLKVLGLAFTLGLVATGASYLLRAARPGEPGRRPLIVIGLLFFALLSAGVITLVLSHPAAWGGMVFGPQWAACLIIMTSSELCGCAETLNRDVTFFTVRCHRSRMRNLRTRRPRTRISEWFVKSR